MEVMNKLQVFNINLNESEINEIVSILMECPAGRVYAILKKLEAQTTQQKKETS
jgi:sugar-specific transcriptional regulator TrmB